MFPPFGRIGGEQTVSHAERLLSGLGGFVGILAVLFISDRLLSDRGSAWVVASMGASAVLLFAVPHGSLSRPWSLVGGHLLSAVVGVSCYRWVSDPMVAGALAVGLAIALMYYLGCLHPPGGATALAAVVGGPSIHALGYGYVMSPVGINLLVLLLVALLFNLPFPWRRYPLSSAAVDSGATHTGEPMIPHSDLVYALSQIDSFIDVEEEDLVRIYTLAMGNHQDASACLSKPSPNFCTQEECQHDGE